MTKVIDHSKMKKGSPENETKNKKQEDNMELFRFVIREGKKIKIPLGEKKPKGKEPHKVVSQKPYTYKWDKKVKEGTNDLKCNDCGHCGPISSFDYDKDEEEMYCPECGSTRTT